MSFISYLLTENCTWLKIVILYQLLVNKELFQHVENACKADFISVSFLFCLFFASLSLSLFFCFFLFVSICFSCCWVAGEAGCVESVKAASDIYCPAAGKIVEVNKALSETPDLINKSPLDKGVYRTN